MAAIKTASRSASVAFAPTDPTALALATQDGALDASFSASASLDLFNLDFASPDPELKLRSSLHSSEKFNSLSWGTAGAGSEEYYYGLLAGGLSDGTVLICNPAPLFREAPEASLVAKSQKHGGRVRGLEFNVLAPNLLASGGDDGDLYIWDLVDPTNPSHFPTLKGVGQEHVVDLSWNRKVQHIMATTSNTGVSVVWDLRRQKSVISFTDPNSRRPCAALEWNPEAATQLIVASADDRAPLLQVWDLRNSISPVKELVGHTKGVLAMAWCPIDSTLLLSSAKDYRTVCWDSSSGEIVCELPVSSNWNFDVQWSPRVAGVFSTSSYDGRVNIYNIEACSRTLPSDSHFGGSVGVGGFSASMKAPRWLKRPVGVTFGFEGKLVSFGVKKGAPGSELTIQTLITEEDLVSQAKEFGAAIEDAGNRPSLRGLCERKAQESGSEEDQEVWSFLRVLFEENARTALLNHLGFVTPMASEVAKETGDANAVQLNADIAEKLSLHGPTSEAERDPSAPGMNGHEGAVDDGADFFNNLSTPKAAVSPEFVLPKTEEEAVAEGIAGPHEENGTDALEEGAECDKAVQLALVRGDFKGAVKQCIADNRMADALVLAHVGGSELWQETLAVYLKKHDRPYRKVLAAVVAHDMGNLVNSRPLTAWRETVALLCSYAGSQEWTLLCDALAARLDAAGFTQEAILCYICAANVEELARLWYQKALINSRISLANKMQDLMEKIVVLALANGEKRVTPGLARFVMCYAELLASQGATATAMEYLNLVPLEGSPEELNLLRDHISSSKQGEPRALDFSYTGNTYQGLATAMPAGPPTSHQTLPTTYETNQQGMYYGLSGASPDQGMGSAYVPPQPQETSYSQPESYPQPGMFIPTAPQVLDRPQPPPPPSSMYQPSFTPSAVNSFTPVNTPPPTNAGSFMPPFPGRASTVPPSNQYSGAMAPPNQFQGMANVGAPFQPPAVGGPTGPAMMFPGSTNPAIMTTPTPRGFVPVSAPRAPVTQQQPGLPRPAMQPQSPSSVSSPRAVQLPATTAPPVTIQTVETGNVPADLKPIIATLSKLYRETSEALGPSKKREIEDNSKKLGGLFAKLNVADISPNARAKLIQICQSLDAGDYATATQLQVSLTTSDWDECGSWLGPLKRMIKVKQSLR